MGGKYILEPTVEVSSDDEIRKSQSFTDKVGVIEQVGIEICQAFLDYALSCIDGFLVVGLSSDYGTEPRSDAREEFMVGKGAPLDDLSECRLILGDKSRIGILHCDYRSVAVHNKKEICSLKMIIR
jgi:hypothetical protein